MTARHFLDGPPARLAALAVAVAAAGLLVWINRADILGTPTAPADPGLAGCVAERHAAVDRMASAGSLKAEQVAAMKAKAEGVCRTMQGK